MRRAQQHRPHHRVRHRARAVSLAAGVVLSAALVATASATATAGTATGASGAAERGGAGPATGRAPGSGPWAVPGAEPAAAGTDTEIPVEYFAGPGAHPRHTLVPARTPDRLAQGKGALAPAQQAADGEVTPIVRKGAEGDKVDVVFIGDGYTLEQQEDFHADVRAKWAEISAVQPYATYRNLFNVWSVDAVSRQSGVSGDPTKDVVKDTALRSYFWCDDLERLLCVDTAKVETYAAKAPDADLVIVLSNSAKYGGAGYNDLTSRPGYDGVATASSDHPDSDQVAVHETGHSLGKLADEYFYPEFGTYTGAEPAASNATKLTAAELTAQRKKWYRWIGQTSPDGGTVGAYEGGDYYPKGINRPTENSIMRTLGREFNLPGREAMIAGFYRHASVLTSRTGKDTVLGATTVLKVEVPESATVSWLVDGKEVTAARGRTEITPRSLGVRADGRRHTVTARATDGTTAVKDPELRKLLTDSRTWKAKG
ncbi:M64 family metallopeptidase [Streptomyces pactum]|uniref:M64 family metallopeptidase n=1 Tax=Streptomyces pactum TaxID=68249 RepID=UPI0036FEBF95